MRHIISSIFIVILWMSANGFAEPNSASMNCTRHGGQIDIRSTQHGDSYTICVFPESYTRDGFFPRSECEEWDFLEGRCMYSQCL